MQIESTFSVAAPIDEVWDALMDFERVATCVPGAEILNKLSDDTYQVAMKVKLGPIAMQYRGQLTVVERDTEQHRAVFEGKAQETRGQGTAHGSATLTLTEADGRTSGSVTADVDLSGKVAAMGKSIIGGVTDQMMAIFAENLQAMLTEATNPAATQQGEAASTTPVPPGGTGTTNAPSATNTGATTPPRPTVRSNEAHSSAAPDNSLNAFSFASRMVMDQLSQPGRMIGVLAAVAFVAFRVGRRVGQKSVH